MKEIYVKELFRNSEEYADKTVTVKGWVRTNRGSNHFGFIELNDGTFFKSVQIVYEEEKMDDFKAFKDKIPWLRDLIIATGRF